MFRHLMFSSAILRSLAGQVKQAGVLSAIGSHAVNSASKTMGPVIGPVALGMAAPAVPHMVGAGYQKYKNYKSDFDPNVLKYNLQTAE
jgi:hypothetical protein